MLPIEVHACADLVGFWQFSAGDGHYYGVLDRAADRSRSTLTIGRIAGGRSEVLKSIVNDDVSVEDVDAAVVGTDLVVVTEVNQGRPLQVVRAALAAVVDPAVKPVPFQAGAAPALTAPQIEGVRLPMSRAWNVADALGPKAWLFSPRIARGDAAALSVIANTADGQAVTPSTDDRAGAIAIPDAAQPQRYVRQGRQSVAFQRPAQPYLPFWTLARYSGAPQPVVGDLMVVEDGGPPQNLSTGLGIGSVAAFAMAGDSSGTPWIFALRDAPGGSRVAALMRRGDRWALVDEWTLDGRGERLSAQHDASGWRLLYATRAGAGWSLRYDAWPRPR